MVKWQFHKLGQGKYFDPEFLNEIRYVYLDGFYSGNYPHKKKVWESLPKRFEESTHLYTFTLSTD